MLMWPPKQASFRDGSPYAWALATDNLSTKLEVSISTHLWRYERRYKMPKMGWFGIVIGSIKVTANSAIRQSTFEFLLAFHSNYVPILHSFWNIARYWSKSLNWTYTTSIWRPRWEWPRRNFAEIFGTSKLWLLGYRAALFAWSCI